MIFIDEQPPSPERDAAVASLISHQEQGTQPMCTQETENQHDADNMFTEETENQHDADKATDPLEQKWENLSLEIDKITSAAIAKVQEPVTADRQQLRDYIMERGEHFAFTHLKIACAIAAATDSEDVRSTAVQSAEDAAWAFGAWVQKNKDTPAQERRDFVDRPQPSQPYLPLSEFVRFTACTNTGKHTPHLARPYNINSVHGCPPDEWAARGAKTTLSIGGGDGTLKGPHYTLHVTQTVDEALALIERR